HPRAYPARPTVAAANPINGRSPMKTVAGLTLVLLAIPAAQAADIEAGKAKVQSVCAACHGANGLSVSDTIPNLAGQKAAYIAKQLMALEEGSSKNPIMNAIDGQLSNDDIGNVAAYFASQPGGASTANSEFLPNVAKSSVVFPENYKSTYTKN